MVSRGGDILVVEFKTGPQNPDFRAALAQVLDYGSDLWGLSYDEFEQSVALRYFKSKRADAVRLKDRDSLVEAAAVVWQDEELTEEEIASFPDRISASLRRGAFHYIIVTQRFTSPMEATAQYLNSSMPDSHFSLIEMVRFKGGDVDALEARSILRGMATPGHEQGRPHASGLLDSIKDIDYRFALEQFLVSVESLGLVIFWGTSGISFRTKVETNRYPSVWGGSSHQARQDGWDFYLTLGYDPASPGVKGANRP